MELIYIWIGKFAGFKDQGFNFSPRWNLDYSLEGKILCIKENKNHHPNFFGDHISNITAIIGQNGSGKSSLLNLLRPSHSEHYLSVEYNPFIVVFYSEGTFYLMHTPTYEFRAIIISNKEINNLENKYSIENITKSRKKDFENVFETILSYTTIYYNFQFEERLPVLGSELIDLSTRNIIKNLEKDTKI